MRVELRNLQRQLGLTFIHVTHNQEEALSMADRIVVMNDARIQQVADPLTIATRPETELVARFMGDNNIIHGKVASRDGDRLVARERRRPGERARAGTTTARSGTRPSSPCARLPWSSAPAARKAVSTPPSARSSSSSSSATSIKLHLVRRGRPHAREAAGRGVRELSAAARASAITIAWKEEDVQLLRVTGARSSTSARSSRPRRSSSSGRPEPKRRKGRQRGSSRAARADRALGGAGPALARLLSDRAARLHRPRQLLDVPGRRVVGLRHRLDARPTTASCSTTASTGTTCARASSAR